MTGATGSKPSVSVVIVSWNALPIVRQCLPSVVATDYPHREIVFVDNASTDGSAEWVRATFPEVRVITHPENWGFCRGNNRAIEETDSEFVVLLNNDVEVEPDWLHHLVDTATADPAIAAVQPKLLQFEDRSSFEYAGAGGGHLDRYGYPFARGRLFFSLETDQGQYDEPSDIFWASGAAVLLRRAALDRVGLLDERFEFHMEEIDLCWRLRSAGWRVVCEPRARAYHMGGGSLARGTPRKTHYNFRNNLLMLYKNLPPVRFRRVFLARVVLDGLAALRFLALGEFRQAFAVFRAYRDAHVMKAAYTPPAGASAMPSYRGSIVWDYWARRRRTFGELPEDRFSLPDRLNR